MKTHYQKMLDNKSFTYKVLDYNSIRKEYKLEHIVTKTIRFMSKEDFDMLYKEQKS